MTSKSKTPVSRFDIDDGADDMTDATETALFRRQLVAMNEALIVAEDMGSPYELATVYVQLAAIASANGKHGDAITAARDAIEERFEGRILSLTDSIVRRWGAISGRVQRETGRPPPVIDTLLAATAIEHGLCLVTRNVKDMAASGVELFNPWDC